MKGWPIAIRIKKDILAFFISCRCKEDCILVTYEVPPFEDPPFAELRSATIVVKTINVGDVLKSRVSLDECSYELIVEIKDMFIKFFWGGK